MAQSAQLSLLQPAAPLPTSGQISQPLTPGTYTATILTSNDPAGTALSGELWASKQATDAYTQDSYTSDAINLGARTFTTVDQYSTLSNIENIAFNATLPATQTLLTVNSITPPVGTATNSTAIFISAENSLPLTTSVNFSPYGFSLPKVYSAYDPTASTKYNILTMNNVFITDPYSGSWSQITSVTPQANTTIAATMTMPTVPIGQSGNTITVNPASGIGLTASELFISDIYSTVWNILMPPDTSSLTLPNVFPPAVVSPLTAGNTYQAAVRTTRFGALSYDQLVSQLTPDSNISITNNFESTRSPAVPFQY